MTTGVATTAVANGFLNAIGGSKTTLTAVTNTYVQLHTADPGAAGTTAVSVGSATRVIVTQSAASGGSIVISGTNPSWTNGGASETITHISVWGAITSGTFLYSAALSASQAWVNTNSFTLTGLTVAVTPLAA